MYLLIAVALVIFNLWLFYKNTQAKRAIAYSCGFTDGIGEAVPSARADSNAVCIGERTIARAHGFKQ